MMETLYWIKQSWNKKIHIASLYDNRVGNTVHILSNLTSQYHPSMYINSTVMVLNCDYSESIFFFFLLYGQLWENVTD